MIVDHKPLVAILGKMLQTYDTSCKEYGYESINMAQEYCTSLGHNYSLQIGYSDTNMRQR